MSVEDYSRMALSMERSVGYLLKPVHSARRSLVGVFTEHEGATDPLAAAA